MPSSPEHHRALIAGRSILVTGGTGSFGQTFAARVAALGAARVRIFSRDEDKQVRMMRAFPDFEYVLGDVRDKDRVRLATRGMDIVFHAAALKHVPNAERHPYEAFQTNVMGSHQLAEACIENDVSIAIGLSTDKAVKPVNAMGMSKAMMEKLFCSRNLQRDVNTRFCCTRYGNILGSRGSVVPLFLHRIARGEPLQVTHPEMTRFLMDVEESVDLVLHALEHARGGELFVKKAPACSIELLAKAVLAMMGSDLPTEIVGVRPGEKMHEVLVSEYEMQRVNETAHFYTVRPEGAGAASGVPFGTEYTSQTTRQIEDRDELVAMLRRCLPAHESLEMRAGH